MLESVSPAALRLSRLEARAVSTRLPGQAGYRTKKPFSLQPGAASRLQSSIPLHWTPFSRRLSIASKRVSGVCQLPYWHNTCCHVLAPVSGLCACRPLRASRSPHISREDCSCRICLCNGTQVCAEGGVLSTACNMQILQILSGSNARVQGQATSHIHFAPEGAQ